MKGYGKRELSWVLVTAALLGAIVMAQPAEGREWKQYESKKYGFAMKIPAEFQLQNEDKGATWIYQPGSAGPSSDTKTSKKKGLKLKLKIKGLELGQELTEEQGSESAGAGGGLESALTIYVNWTWMPDVSAGTLYSSNVKSTTDNIKSPDPDYTALTVFDKKKGYAYEGNTYWYKEVDKKDPDEIHRWHIGAYGNKSSYIVGLCGNFGQFGEWGPVYEEIVKSFRLIPMEQ